MKASKSKHVSLFGVLFIFFLISIIIVGAVLFTQAKTDNISNLYTAPRSENTFLKTILKGSLFGKDFTVSEQEFNEYINQHYCNDSSDRKGADHLRIFFHSDEPSEIYAHAYIFGTDFAMSANADFEFDSGSSVLSVKLSNAKIGELHVPDQILSLVLSSMFDDRENLSVSGTTVSALCSYSFDLKNTSFNVRLCSFVPSEGVISCRTNSLTAEALRAAAEYLMSDDGKQLISTAWDAIKKRFE